MGALCSTITSKVVAPNATDAVKIIITDPVVVEVSSVVPSTTEASTKELKETGTTDPTVTTVTTVV